MSTLGHRVMPMIGSILHFDSIQPVIKIAQLHGDLLNLVSAGFRRSPGFAPK
jgi:hypothetical protein